MNAQPIPPAAWSLAAGPSKNPSSSVRPTGGLTILTSLLGITFLAASAQASIIVQWGAAGGDSTILTATGNTDGQNGDLPTTYGAGPVNPADGTGGYSTSVAGRTNEFYGAASHTNMPAWFVGDNPDGSGHDYMQLVRNFGSGNSGTFSTMLAWNSSDFLTSDSLLESFNIEFRTRDTGDPSTVSFLLETSAGWYVTDQTFVSSTNAAYLSVSENIADLTFSGFSQFGVTAGTGSADTADIQSVGFFSSTDSTSAWAGNFVRHFEVTAATAVPEASDSLLLGLGMFGMLLHRHRRAGGAAPR